MNLPNSFAGIEVTLSPMVPSEYVRKQVRFPRSKKKRIRKKWAKDPRNWKTFEKPSWFSLGGRFYTNQAGMDALQGMIENQGR